MKHMLLIVLLLGMRIQSFTQFALITNENYAVLQEIPKKTAIEKRNSIVESVNREYYCDHYNNHYIYTKSKGHSNTLLNGLDILSTNESIILNHSNYTIDMKGKSEINFYLNNKKLYLSKFQFYRFLQSLSAIKIYKIEIITTSDVNYNSSTGVIKIWNN